MTWTAWTFRIHNKAYKNVRPLTMELVREKRVLGSSGMLWWRKEIKQYTGRWAIILRYDRGPATQPKKDVQVFEREDEARFWFNQTFDSVFTAIRKAMPPLPPKNKKTQKKKPNLRLL